MKHKISFPAVGASSLLVVFAVVCLTVFSMLCISTVLSEERLAEASLKSVTDYYAADCEAEQILARLRAGETPENVLRDGNVYSYSCGISDTQILCVSVRLTEDRYEILRWQVVPADHWQADDKLPVYTHGSATKE